MRACMGCAMASRVATASASAAAAAAMAPCTPAGAGSLQCSGKGWGSSLSWELGEGAVRALLPCQCRRCWSTAGRQARLGSWVNFTAVHQTRTRPHRKLKPASLQEWHPLALRCCADPGRTIGAGGGGGGGGTPHPSSGARGAHRWCWRRHTTSGQAAAMSRRSSTPGGSGSSRPASRERTLPHVACGRRATSEDGL